MNKSVIQIERQLMKTSIQLREAIPGCRNYENAEIIRKRQNDVYNKWKFVKNLTLAMEKQNKVLDN